MSDDQNLLPEHLSELQEGSGINRETIDGRGYRTVTSKATLRRYGFGVAQGGEGPWLFIPLYSPDSDFKTPSGYQIKASVPRVDSQGKVMKYEFPKGTMSIMDVHPSQAGRLADVSVPLYITEGTKKADAAVSHGLLALSVPGVWGWKAGQLPHEAWNVIPLQGRKVLLAFDSDATTKPNVWDALAALLTFLKKRGALVQVISLPVLTEGTKTGLDDYLRQYPATSLDAYASDDLPSRPEEETATGLVFRTQDGEIIKLANFDARIVADIVKDDGIETQREVEVQADLGQTTRNFVLSVDRFEAMDWNIDHLGSDAILFAGRDIPQKAREVIQAKSIGKEERHVYVHTGWRKLRLHSEKEPEWCYLTPAGAIAASGLVPSVAVDLGDVMAGIALPDPPTDADETAQAVRDSLLLIDEEDGVMPYQMYFSIWRAAMGPVPFGYWLYGSTGVGKSEIAALAQQHWGPELTPAKFLANWMSTENYINEIAFKAKDMILVVDDFRISGNRTNELRLTQTADRLFRSQGNTAGRGRMKRDLTLAVGHPVRCMLFSTAEELPEGESLLARMIAEELRKDPSRFDKLDVHQMNAISGQYAKAMSAFLRWFASRYEPLTTFLRDGVIEQRKKFHGKHRRTQEAGAHLLVGAMIYLQFAEDVGAISAIERSRYLDLLAAEVRQGAMEQSIVQRYANPIRQARELLLVGLEQRFVHIEGWPGSAMTGQWIGWLQGEELLLHATAFRGAINNLARNNDVAFHISGHRLGQALAEEGWLGLDQSSVEQAGRHSEVAKYGGRTFRVYRLPKTFLTEVEEGPIDIEIQTEEEAY